MSAHVRAHVRAHTHTSPHPNKKGKKLLFVLTLGLDADNSRHSFSQQTLVSSLHCGTGIRSQTT